jgi:5-methylcytosine-specific restriction endonuclease McrA
MALLPHPPLILAGNSIVSTPFWKNHPPRQIDSAAYTAWRDQVIVRDGRRCQLCSKVPRQVEIHHIKTWESTPELRYSVDNGVTLCRRCHRYKVNYHEREYEAFFMNKVAQKTSPDDFALILKALYGDI